MYLKIPQAQSVPVPHSSPWSNLSPPSQPPPHRNLDGPASSSDTEFSGLPGCRPPGLCSTPTPLPAETGPPPIFPCATGGTIPLQDATTQIPEPTTNLALTIQMVSTCIDMCVAIVAMYITSTEGNETQKSHRKQMKRREGDEAAISPHSSLG